jgi:hypothetical protein
MHVKPVNDTFVLVTFGPPEAPAVPTTPLLGLRPGDLFVFYNGSLTRLRVQPPLVVRYRVHFPIFGLGDLDDFASAFRTAVARSILPFLLPLGLPEVESAIQVLNVTHATTAAPPSASLVDLTVVELSNRTACAIWLTANTTFRNFSRSTLVPPRNTSSNIEIWPGCGGCDCAALLTDVSDPDDGPAAARDNGGGGGGGGGGGNTLIIIAAACGCGGLLLLLLLLLLTRRFRTLRVPADRKKIPGRNGGGGAFGKLANSVRRLKTVDMSLNPLHSKQADQIDNSWSIPFGAITMGNALCAGRYGRVRRAVLSVSETQRNCVLLFVVG